VLRREFRRFNGSGARRQTKFFAKKALLVPFLPAKKLKSLQVIVL
jgi:hypothetical protein